MNNNKRTSSLMIGVILLVIGVLGLFGNFINSLNMDNLWPLIVVGVGIIFFIPVALSDKSRAGLAVPACILVMVGLILLMMNYMDNWEAWSYCWALIVVASGAGVWIHGYVSEQPELRKRGLDTIRTGLILFVIFAVIMEFIFTISGEHRLVNSFVWAILLSLLGLVLLVTRLLRIGKPGSEQLDLFWPILMMGVGATAILFQLNWIPADNLGRLLNLWPLLLIVAGVGILLRNRSPWVGAILGILVVAGMLVVSLFGAQLDLSAQPSWLSGIGPIQIGDIQAQRVVGSGNQISEDRSISGVSRVELAIPADLEIKQGSVEALTVQGDDNVLPLLVTDVIGGKLTIRYESQVEVSTNQRPRIGLTVKDLRGLQLSSSGSVKVASITTGDFDLNLSSSGDIDIQGLQVDKITTHLSSSGDITIQGTANQLELDVSSSGSFQAGDLEVQDADVNLTSSGDVTLWVVNVLQAKISSSGNVHYYGNPIVRQSITSSGELISRGDK